MHYTFLLSTTINAFKLFLICYKIVLSAHILKHGSVYNYGIFIYFCCLKVTLFLNYKFYYTISWKCSDSIVINFAESCLPWSDYDICCDKHRRDDRHLEGTGWQLGPHTGGWTALWRLKSRRPSNCPCAHTSVAVTHVL